MCPLWRGCGWAEDIEFRRKGVDKIQPSTGRGEAANMLYYSYMHTTVISRRADEQKEQRNTRTGERTEHNQKR